MTPGKAVLFTVVLLALLGVAALVRRYQRAQATLEDCIARHPAGKHGEAGGDQ